MAQFWVVTCKSCGAEILCEPFGGGGKVVEWHKADKVKCGNPACLQEHQYSGNEFHLAEGELPLI